MKIKKLFTLALTAALTISLAACSGGASATKMTMGTGGSAGTYYGYGGVLGQYIKNKAGIDVTVVATDGSKANIQGIDSGKVDSFRVVAGLYAEAVQLVTMDPNIKSAKDLAGKAVSIGAPGSGVYFNAIDVLTAAGLTENDIKPQYLSFADSADALKDGKIDAAFVVAGAPTPAITELCTTNDAYLVPLDGDVADAMMAACPFYTTYVIPAGTYPGQDADVTTVTVKATLIVSASASEDDVYNLTKAIFDNAADIAKENGKGAELSLDNATSGMTAPFHKGAAKYFAEQGITVDAQ